MNKNVMNGLRKAGVIASTALVSMHAAAQEAPAGGPDLSGLTGQISFGTVTAAVLSVAAGLGLVYVAIKGARIVLGMIRR